MEWHRRISAWAAPRWQTIDIALAIFFFAGGVLAIQLVEVTGSERPPDVFAYLLIAAAALPVIWRRTRPLHALFASVVPVIIYWVADYSGGFDPVLWTMFYSATRHGGADRRHIWRVTSIALALIVIVATIGVIVPTEDLHWLAIAGLFLIHGTAAMIGEALYQRSQHVLQLEQRAAALEADLENKAALAAVEERTRIAREMHDIIAHGMTSVVVQAQAAKSVVDSDPDRTREVLNTIEQIGRDSVDEMRRMLGVLRNGDSDLELGPQPNFDDLDELQRQVAAAGIELDLQVTGNERPLPPGLELAGYRVVQEALTNVIRHAGQPVAVSATIDYGADSLDIEVTDDGLGAAASSETAGTGHGLLGIRERVEIYNGTFQSGPRAGGGFHVRVCLPMPSQVTA